MIGLVQQVLVRTLVRMDSKMNERVDVMNLARSRLLMGIQSEIGRTRLLEKLVCLHFSLSTFFLTASSGCKNGRTSGVLAQLAR